MFVLKTHLQGNVLAHLAAFNGSPGSLRQLDAGTDSFGTPGGAAHGIAGSDPKTLRFPLSRYIEIKEKNQESL